MADVVFPLETHAEKDGTVTHPDGRLQRVRPSAGRPGDIRPNWGVLAELSLALGHDTGIDSQPSAFQALTEAAPIYSGLTDAEIGGRGIRWQDRPAASLRPSPAEASEASGPSEPDSPDTQRGAPTGNTEAAGAARGVASAESGSDGCRSSGRSGSGRTGTFGSGAITELNPPLRFLAPQQRVEMSVDDAERLGLKDRGHGSRSPRTGPACEAAVDVKERMPTEPCFLIEGTAEGNANALLNGGPVEVTIAKVGE